MSKHYVARIVVEKVEKEAAQATGTYSKVTVSTGERTVTELGNVTLKGNDVQELLASVVEAAGFIKDYE